MLGIRDGVIHFFRSNFFVSQWRKISQGNLSVLCSRKNLITKKNMEKRGGGVEYQEFPSKGFCLTLPKNFVGEPISVSLFLGIDNFFCFRGLSHDFLSKIFRLTEQKNFVGEPFFVSQNFWHRKYFLRRGGWGSIRSFRRNVFVSFCRKSS